LGTESGFQRNVGQRLGRLGQPGEEPLASERDTDEVRELYLRAMEGWNLGSAETFVAPFADDADFVAFDGVRFRGREELVRVQEPLLKTH
jgi:hypothetical protein